MSEQRYRPQGLIGVVHLSAMPGDPGYRGGGFAGVLEAALRDAEAWCSGGADALIVENFGSAPFPKGHPEQPNAPHVIALLARVVSACRPLGLPVGVNVLRNDARAALGVAAACEASFVRVNVHVGAYLTDQGVIEGRAYETLRDRRHLDADAVAILADVRVKHAAPLAARPLADEVGDLVARGMADAVIVTGRGTGAPIDIADLTTVRDAAGACPVLLGSGVSPDRIASLRPHADAAIVGTWAKVDGAVANPVDSARVARLRAAWDAAGSGDGGTPREKL